MSTITSNLICFLLSVYYKIFRMKAALKKARQSYQFKYKEFIQKIERDADEVQDDTLFTKYKI